MSRTSLTTFCLALWLLTLPAFGQTTVSGDISQDTTWDVAGSPYVLLTDVHVLDGITLTIQPGASVQFPHYLRDLIVDGTLDANGTAKQPIQFVGSNPDAGVHGGSVTLRAPSQDNVINNAVFEKLGDVSSAKDASLWIATSSAIVTNCTFFDAERTGIHVPQEVTPTIADCQASAGTYDVRAHPGALTSFGPVEGLIWLENDAVTFDATWPANTYSLLADVFVAAGVKLTIQPGASVQFPHYFRDLIVDGTLDARGTANAPVKFLGANPDQDVNGGSVVLTSNSTESHIEHAEFRELGDASSAHDTALDVSTSSVTITRSCFALTERVAIYIRGLAQPVITYCQFAGNWEDIHAAPISLKYVRNNEVEICVAPGVLSESVSWARSTYVLLGDVRVDTNATLTLEPGATLVFPDWSRNLLIDGRLNATGRSDARIFFAGPDSDKSRKGGAVVLSPSAYDSAFYYSRFVRLGAAQSPYDCALSLSTSSVSIQHCEFVQCDSAAIRVLESSPTVSKCDFESNAFGVINTGKGIVGATDNWWGDASGPFHSSNPSGLGDAVSDGVLFSPWRNLPTRFVLTSNASLVSPGDTLSLSVEFGSVGGQAWLGAVAIDGVEVFPTLYLLGTFDGQGQWGYDRIVPMGLSGMTVTFKAHGIDTCGDLSSTERIDVSFE